jgi:hypothetical protein
MQDKTTPVAVGAPELAKIEVENLNRSTFLMRGVLAAGAVYGTMAAGPLLRKAFAQSSSSDIDILNYALTLEYLEAEFYKQAVASGAITQPEVRAFATTVASHEATHVKTLKGILGSKAVKKPKFDFGDTVTNQDKFKMTAQVLEDTGVAAYAGQGPNLLQRPLVVAALSIHSVEARHAAWIRFINSSGGLRGTGTSSLPAPKAFDKALSEKKVLSAVKKTGFIKG